MFPLVGMRGGYLSGFGDITATSVTATGTVTASALVGDIGVTRNPGPMIAGDTGSLTVVSGTAYAQYVGRVPKALSSVDIHYYLHGVSAVAGGGGDSLNWAEVAIASGALGQFSTTPSLTFLGYTSINAAVTAASTVWKTATVTATVPANTDLWVVVAAAYETTQPSFRIPTNWVNGRGYAATKTSTRPSTAVGAQAFSSSVTTGTVVPFMSMQW